MQIAKRIRHILPEVGKVQLKDPIVHARFYHKGLNREWYVLAGEQKRDDYVFFGLMIDDSREIGLFTANELEALVIKNDFVSPVKNDYRFKPARLSKILKQ